MASYQGTAGDDSFVGTSASDIFQIGQGGNDTVRAGDGDDQIEAGAALGSRDAVHGGAGWDLLSIAGDYSAGLAWTAQSFSGIERLLIGDAATSTDDYVIRLAAASPDPDGYASLSIDASALQTGTLSFNASGVSDASLSFTGGAAADRLTGGALNDDFDLTNGGADTALGGAGADSFYGVSADVVLRGGADDDIFQVDDLTAGARIDGGEGADTLWLGYGAEGPLTLSGRQVTGIEAITFAENASFDLTLQDALATGRLSIAGDGWRSSFGSYRVDAASERDAQISFTGWNGADWYRGGRLDDRFDMLGTAADTVFGGAGDDTFIFDSLTGADRIDGGAGFDKLSILNSSGEIRFEAETLRNVEAIFFFDGPSLVFDDGNLRRGQQLKINGAGADHAVDIDGSAERYGSFWIEGSSQGDTISTGRGMDTLIGGRGDDELSGGGGDDVIQADTGADRLTGGGGADRFVFGWTGESLPEAPDTVADLTDQDVIDLHAIDARISKAGNQAFQLAAHFTHREGQAVLSYDAVSDRTSLALDVDGDAVADTVVVLDGNHLDFTNFAL
jgi:Ca2+-binding RTX toxin-like protein